MTQEQPPAPGGGGPDPGATGGPQSMPWQPAPGVTPWQPAPGVTPWQGTPSIPPLEAAQAPGGTPSIPPLEMAQPPGGRRGGIRGAVADVGADGAVNAGCAVLECLPVIGLLALAAVAAGMAARQSRGRR